MNESKFTATALGLLTTECSELTDLADSLAHDKSRVAEFKCAKYRYASVFIVKVTLEGILRTRKNRDLSATDFLPEYYDAILRRNPERFDAYLAAENKPDAALYLCLNAFIDEKVSGLSDGIGFASDWEKIEADERLKGLSTARDFLERAWRAEDGKF